MTDQTVRLTRHHIQRQTSANSPMNTDRFTSAGGDHIISASRMTKWPLTCCTVDLNHKRESWGRGDRRKWQDRGRAAMLIGMRQATLITASLELSSSSQRCILRIPENREPPQQQWSSCPAHFEPVSEKPEGKSVMKISIGQGLAIILALIQSINPDENTDLFWISSSKPCTSW